MGRVASLMLFFATGCSTPPYSKSDHFDGKKFFNPGVKVEKGFLDLVRWKMAGGVKGWPERLDNREQPKLPHKVATGDAHITFIGHATHLLQFSSVDQERPFNVLTDPIFSERASPVSWAGPKRVRPPGLTINELPPIDVIVVSHNHYDHLDVASIRAISERDKTLILVPLGNKKLLKDLPNVEELDWWESRAIGSNVRITATPSQHWSARGLFDRNEALWSSWVFEAGGVKTLFAGDTGYGPHFKAIRDRLGLFQLSILPIGAYEPRWFMKEAHMSPEDALLAWKDLGHPRALGTHYGTFQLTNEGIDEPATVLTEGLKLLRAQPSTEDSASVKTSEFLAPETGETVRYKGSENHFERSGS